jgi:predicted kinase
MIVMMAGLPGTGKTTLARELAGRTGGRVISKDEIRHAIFGADEIEYSTRQDDFCMQIALQLAGQLGEKNPERKLFLDGRSFSRRYQVENAVAAAEALGQRWRIIECRGAERTIRERLQEQSSLGTHPAHNRDWKLYLEMVAKFETITLPKTVIDSTQPLERCVDLALAAIFADEAESLSSLPGGSR